jgi:hypothetical protein
VLASSELSFRKVYDDHENHDYDHENDSQTFHTARINFIHHPKHIATSYALKLWGNSGCGFLGSKKDIFTIPDFCPIL